MTATTRDLARYLVNARYDDLPDNVRREGPRTFLNWLGCVYGGLRDPASETGYRALGRYVSPGEAVIIGRGRTADPVNATFFNTLASCTHGYDDAHLSTVAHPGGPAAAAALVAAQVDNASGIEILNALLLGVEIQCRVSAALVEAPRVPMGFYMTGLTGALGAAAAAGKIFKLGEQQMCWALGIAAAQGAGFRETHASMANALVRAQAARNGMTAALLARDGFTCTETAMEGDKGFMAVFGSAANLGVVTDGLGSHYELLNNTYKVYPGAMPINPIVDACLDLAERVSCDEIETVELDVSSLAMSLTGRRTPSNVEEARVSLFHWAAAALVRRRAGLAEIEQSCVVDPVIVQMRSRIAAKVDPSLPPEAARAMVRLRGGGQISVEIADARGTVRRPISNSELEKKVEEQAEGLVDKSSLAEMIKECWTLESEIPLASRRLHSLLR